MADAKKAAATKKKSGSDAKYFHTTKKGEIAELKQDLNSLNKEKIKDAIKKVIAAMTVGKDVSMLFTDVVKSMQTDNIELKKLVYLYIINYARSQPDKAILVVNTFCKDARDPSPLVRALAIRTMGCIRVDRITEYLCEPLRQALKDSDPYVRKTAAVCTAKLYDINPELVEEQDFLDRLRDMISDPNSMVVANAVAALAEISESSGKDVFQINGGLLNKLLAALNECTEWGQVFILDSLAQYNPTAKEAETIIERVSPRLQHANSAVAMSAIKVIMKYLDVVKNPALVNHVVNHKLPPPLITLLSEHKPEIQYVALRNINLIVQKRPDVLAREVKHFFCKYNDPIYVKMEKLEIMIKLAAADNIEQVLLELKEYATEVDVEFVRKSVRAIGRCAIKLDVAAERCIKVLLELIQTKVNYVVQEAIVVIKDIFRKYPNRYESIIATLCENLDTLDEPEAKASMIWIIGEYAARIENAPELLEGFVESFADEPAMVQLQTLTATVKLFLRRPDDAKKMVTKVLSMATDNSDNPDLRDRGYVYWRLLSTDPEAAQKVVLADKPVINDDTYQLDNNLLDLLIGQISTLASIYHKPPESFVQGAKGFKGFAPAAPDAKGGDGSESDAESDGKSGSGEESGSEESGDEEDKGDGHADAKATTPAAKATSPKPSGPAVLDLFGFGSPTSANDHPLVDMPTIVEPPAVVHRRTLISSDEGKGFVLHSTFVRKDGQVYMDMEFENHTSQDLKTFAIKFKKNFYSVNPVGNIEVPPVRPGNSTTAQLLLDTAAEVDRTVKVGPIQMAIKTDVGVFYFADTLPTFVLFQEDTLQDKKEYLAKWKDLGEEEQKLSFDDAQTSDIKDIKARLSAHNVFYIAKRTVPEKGEVLYLTVKIKNTDVLLELTVGGTHVSGAAKSADVLMAKAALFGISELLKQ